MSDKFTLFYFPVQGDVWSTCVQGGLVMGCRTNGLVKFVRTTTLATSCWTHAESAVPREVERVSSPGWIFTPKWYICELSCGDMVL